MQATPATKRRPRKSAAATRHPTETYQRDAVLLKVAALDELFELEGIKTFEDKARAIGYPSVGLLHRAYKGGGVSAGLLVAIRRWFPCMPYEELFYEGQTRSERKVAAHAPAHLAA